MPARNWWETPCHAERMPEKCRDQCLASLLGDREALNGDRLCPAHQDKTPRLSLNPGNSGRRMVWRCHYGCTAEAVRSAFLDLGADPTCLGAYADLDQPTRLSSFGAGIDSVTMASAKRWYAVAKLPELNGMLMRMCIQAIADGDGDLPGDPLRLLPVNADDFYALADRAGVKRTYKYKLYEKWLRS